MTPRRALLAVVAALCALAASAHASVPAWTTYRHDGARSGFDPDSGAAIPPVQAWQTNPALDGDIYGQPLVYGSRVYVATENNTVYALDTATGAVVWQRHVGTPVPERQTAGCGDIGSVGITSTPVIDPSTGRIFAVATTWDGANTSSIRHLLVGFDLGSGSPVPGLPLAVDPPGSHPVQQLQRPGLALDAGRIVVGYGGHAGDCGDYHGWLVSVPEAGGALSVFEVEPNQTAGEGAIWGAGNAPAVDAAGNVWVSTGNGVRTAFGLQESVVKLDPTMHVLDHWTPANWATLDATDGDLGSSEPVLLPGNLVFQIGKEGVGDLLSASSLGGTAAAPVFQANVCASTGGYGGAVYSAGVIYVACLDGLRALALDAQARRFAAVRGWTVNAGAIGPPIVAGGLVWSAGWNTRVLYGLDPTSGATRFSATLGGFDHFASPGAAGGRLFVANRNRVTAFTIANPPPSPTATAPPRSPIANAPLPSPTATAAPARRLKLSRVRISVSGHTVTVTLALSARAKITVVVGQRVHGHKVRRRCVRHARRGRRCTLTVRKATRTFSVARGRHRLKLRLRSLPPGHYSAVITARDSAGNRTRALTIAFTIRARAKRKSRATADPGTMAPFTGVAIS